MLEQVLEFAPIAKYIVIAIGIIGAIMLVLGIYQGNRMQMTRGGYMLALAIIIWVCSHLLYSVSNERAYQRIYQIQEQYGD